MLAIEVAFLADRFTASAFNDRQVSEWPPHPARLFSALVAAYHDEDAPDPAERRVLTFLEALGAPDIACATDEQLNRRSVVTHFVPVNDPRATHGDVSSSYLKILETRDEYHEARASGDAKRIARAEKAFEKAEAKQRADHARTASPKEKESLTVIEAVLTVLPEHRGKQARFYPTIRLEPGASAAVFSWRDAELSASEAETFEGLLGRVARLGHSSSPVSCRLIDAPPEATHVPVDADANGGIRIRVPRAGLLDQLERTFAVTGGREAGPLAAATARYRHAVGEPPALPSPLLGGDWIPLTFPNRVRLPLARTLDVTRALRNALIAHDEDPPAEILTGHQPRRTDGSSSTSATPHLAFVPLANVGHPRSDGYISGLAIVFPRDVSESDRVRVLNALGRWESANGLQLRLADANEPPLHLARQPLDPADSPLSSRGPLGTRSRSYWCRPARAWTSVTPIALDRFPRHYNAEDPERRAAADIVAADTIRKACMHAGLPEPSEVYILVGPPLAGVPSARRGGRRGRSGFPPFATGSRRIPRLTVHARIVFDEPVSGPVLIGAARYFGYGLCLPELEHVAG